MELVRPDYLKLVDQVRHVLRSLEPELQTAKARDDLACAERVLCLFEAEHDFLSENHANLLAAFDRIAAELSGSAKEQGLTSLFDGLAAIGVRHYADPRGRLLDLRRLYQMEIPAIGKLADDGDRGASSALMMLLDLETAQFEDVHRRRRGFAVLAEAKRDGGAPGAAKQMPDREQLRAYLRATFPQENDLDVTSVHNVPGGRSKETTMIGLSGAKSLPDKIVMRSDIPGGLVPSRTSDEFAILGIADRHGIPVPKPIYCEVDPAHLDRTFILVSAIPGATEGEYFPDLGGRVTDKPGVGRQLARILARINSIPVSELHGTHIDTDINLTDMVRETIEGTYAQARACDDPARIHLEMAYRWLKANLHLAEDEPCLIHCDVGLHNMLIEDGRVTAMLDWELATLASPSREISKIFHLIDYLMPREDFFAEYLAAGGPQRAIDPERMNFYAILNYMVTHQRARYANQLFYTGAQPSIVMGHAGYDSFYRGVSLISDALKPVYADAYGGPASQFVRMKTGEV